jgi:sec-independent protein translocase protein TatB
MPQIGWFEILVIVLLSILIVGPKDFPIMLKKISSWARSIKGYIYDVQREVTKVETSIDNEISLNKKLSNLTNRKKDE